MAPEDKPLAWLAGELKTPPLSQNARLEAGFLLRQLQKGVKLSLPQSRPMPSVGERCHELRIRDENATWRIVYRIDEDFIVLLEVFSKKTQKTPPSVTRVCRGRLKLYDEANKR